MSGGHRQVLILKGGFSPKAETDEDVHNQTATNPRNSVFE
jgi:hypothetical protein